MFYSFAVIDYCNTFKVEIKKSTFNVYKRTTKEIIEGNLKGKHVKYSPSVLLTLD